MLTDVLDHDFAVSLGLLERVHGAVGHVSRAEARQTCLESQDLRTVFILKIWFAAELLPAWPYGLLPWAAPLRFLPVALGMLFAPN